MTKIKQLFCRHKYEDKNRVVEVSLGRCCTDTIRLKNYCVKCGKSYEIQGEFVLLLNFSDIGSYHKKNKK